MDKAFIDEADPERLEERQNDEKGSFLDIYRSRSLNTDVESFFVEKSVENGIVPASVRYGIMRRGDMEAHRGVIKSTRGDLYYFSWHSGAEFKLIKADSPEKTWEANKLLKSCQLGCDLIKVGEAEEDADPAEKAVGGMPITEEQSIAAQSSQEVHPGAAGAQTPDDPAVGREWHKALSNVSDGLAKVGDGTKHWSKADLIKAYGQQLQQSAPNSVKLGELERKYLTTVLGIGAEEINKGFRLQPRHFVEFERWKSSQIRTKLTGLQEWLAKKESE